MAIFGKSILADVINQFGKKVKKLRRDSHLLQREVASRIGIDVPMLSKIESGDRRAKKDLVILLSELFNADVEELIALWLADQVVEIVRDENLTLRVMQIAANAVKINSSKRQ